MSKRFGRNQRRRARERIAALETRNSNLEQAHVLDRELSASLGAKLHDAQHEIKRAKAILGRYCVVFMPEHRRLELDFTGELRMPEPPRPWSVGAMANPEEAMTRTFQAVALDVIAARLHDDPIRYEMHFRATFRDGAYGYAVTKSALMLMDRGDAVRLVSDSLAQSLVAHEQKKERRA